jgi:hypothetical protein
MALRESSARVDDLAAFVGGSVSLRRAADVGCTCAERETKLDVAVRLTAPGD